MPDHLIRKLELRDHLSSEEKTILHGATGRRKDVGPNEDLVRERDRPTDSTLLLQGYSIRHQVLSGGSRQITAIHVPGDFVDLHGFTIKQMDHGVTTLTACRVALVPHATLRQITETQPHLTRLLWMLTVIDAAIHRRWLTAMGRQSSLSHTAHLICELHLRQNEVLAASGLTFRMPLTQAKLADALGLSAVHTNRVVQELREAGFLSWKGEEITILDLEGLRELAEFDPTYLSLRKEPR